MRNRTNEVWPSEASPWTIRVLSRQPRTLAWISAPNLGSLSVLLPPYAAGRDDGCDPGRGLVLADIAAALARVAGPIAGRAAAGGVRWATFTLRATWNARREFGKVGLPRPGFWRLHRLIKQSNVVEIFVSGSPERLQELTTLIGSADLGPRWTLGDDQAQHAVSALLLAITDALPTNRSTAAQVQTLGARIETVVTSERANYGDSAFESALKSFSPAVRGPAREVSASWPDLRRLATELAAAPDRRQAIREWSQRKPSWLLDAPAPAVLWLSAVAEDFALHAESASFIEEALEKGAVPASFWRLRRGLLLSSEDRVEQKKVLTAVGDDHPLVAILSAFLDEDSSAAVSLMKAWAPPSGYERRFQAFLSVQLLAAADDWDEAVRVARSELQSGSAGPAQFVADRLLDRRIERTSALHFAQLTAALDLVIEARDVLRSWDGPSTAAVETAIRILEALGDSERAWALTDIKGQATATEAAHPSIRDRAVLLAAEVRPLEEADQAVETAPPSLRRTQARALLAERRHMSAKAVEHWREAMNQASRPEDQLRIGFQLARHGELAKPLVQLEKDLPVEVGELRLIADLNAGAPGALERLRGAARRSRHLTFGLISHLQRTNELEQAAQVAEDGARRWADAELWLTSSRLHEAAENYARAAVAARSAISESPPGWSSALEAHFRLIEALSADSRWMEATDAAAATMVRFPGNPSVVWALVLCQMQLGKNEDAWKTWTVFASRPEPRNEREASAAIYLLQHFEPAETAVDAILNLEGRWSTNERLQTQAAHALIALQSKLSPAAQERSAKRVSELIQELPHVFVPQAIDTDNIRESLDDIVSELPDHSELDRLIGDGTMPYGMAATVTRHSFAETLAARQSPLFAEDPVRSAADMDAARAVRGATVVLDATAAIALAYFDDDIAEQMMGFAASISAPLAHLLDANRSREGLSSLSTMSMGRSPDGSAQLHRITDDEAHARLRRAERVTTLYGGVSFIERTWPTRIPDFGDRLDEFVWLEALDLALDSPPLALWCDDVRVRHLAAGLGVPTFGTIALIRVMKEEGLFPSDVALHLEAVLAQRGYVGGAYDVKVATAAADLDRWAPQGVAAYLAWSPVTTRAESVTSFALTAIRRNLDDPGAVQGWAEAISQWLVRLGGDEQNLIVLLRKILVEDWLTPATLPFVLLGIRAVTGRQGLKDPFEPALLKYYGQLTSLVEPQIASSLLRSLVSLAPEQDRHTALRIMLSA